MVVTPDGSKAYVSSGIGSKVWAINTNANTVTATIPVGSGPAGLAVTPDGSKVYVANLAGNSVSVIDVASNSVVHPVPLASGATPYAFGQFIQPGAVFSAFNNVKLKLVPGQFGSFDLNATFVLAAQKSIDPVTQPVTFSIGPYRVKIPAGSFHQLKNGAKKGGWVFSGNVGGVSLDIQIDPLGGGAIQFKATGSPVNFTGITSPTAVSISINGNHGVAQAQF